MVRRVFLTLVGVMVSVLIVSSGGTAKLKLGTPVKVHDPYLLPLLAAEEKGLWKAEGLDAEWVPMKGGPELTRAMAAGSISLGMNYISGVILTIIRGIPALVVADAGSASEWWSYVRFDSRIKGPKDLKGAKIGLTRFGSLGHAYAQTVVKAVGLDLRDVKLVASGGLMESLAALRAGVLDVWSTTVISMLALEHQGLVRRVMRV